MAEFNNAVTQVHIAVKAHPYFTLFGLILIVLIVAGWIKGFDREDVKWIVKRYSNIFRAQAKGTVRELLGHIAVLAIPVALSLVVGTLFFRAGDGALFDLNYTSGDAPMIPVTTITTTMFATLMSIILALVALAVTAYVFLNDALSKRNECEHGIILDMKESTRRRLFAESVFSGMCVVAILVVDNADLRAVLGSRIAWVRYAVLVAGLLDAILLLFFISAIVNYEKRLLALAQSYIDVNGKNLVKKLEKSQQLEVEQKDPFILVDPAEIIKSIGDLEMLLSSILSNHESEFRFQKGLTSAVMLKAILKENQRKAKENRETGKTAETGGNTSNNEIDELYESYRKLVEIRNCIWVLQNAGQEPKAQYGLIERAKSIGTALQEFAFRDERFLELNFNATDFSNFCFEKSAFRESAMLDVNFSGAKLQDTDFSGTLLQKPNFEGADCTGAVFTEARIISPKINRESKFEKAVFRNLDLTVENRESIKPDSLPAERKELYQFKFSQTSAHHARFMSCIFRRFDFRESVFSSATFSDAILIACNFNQTDLSDAIMVHAMISRSCDFSYSYCSGLMGAYSSWGEVKKRDKEDKEKIVDPFADKLKIKWLNLTGARFERANLAEAILTRCLFHKAYLNYASLTAAEVTGCDFADSFMKSVDFTDTVLNYCTFDRAFLTDTLVIGETEEAKRQYEKETGLKQKKDSYTIKNTSFIKTDLQRCSIRNHRFEGCFFDGAILNDASIRDVEFVRCSFNNAHFNGAMLFNVTWNACMGRPRTDREMIEFGTQVDEDAWTAFSKAEKTRGGAHHGYTGRTNLQTSQHKEF